MPRIAVLLAVLAMIAVPSARQTMPVVSPGTARLQPAAFDQATALLDRFVAERQIAGAVAGVARGGTVGYLKAVGVQDLVTRTPMTERSLFRIYSMTKAVTAVAAMMLHDEGKFRLDDPVAKYLPEFDGVQVVTSVDAPPRRPTRPIKIEDLLLHTSGLSHRTSDLYRTLGVRSRADTLPTFVAKVVKAPLMEDPHTRFRYSEATTVIGRLVEVWSGQPFDRFLASRLLEPLGMTDTVFWVERDRGARLASVYGPAPGGGLAPVDIEPLPFTERPALLEGAVGLVSSVPDFLRFQQMLLDGGTFAGTRLLSATTVARITANGLPADVLAARGGRMGWGLANVNVLMSPDGSGASVGEYGWDGTAGTIFWNDPEKGTAIVLMTQSVPANPDGLRQLFKAAVMKALE